MELTSSPALNEAITSLWEDGGGRRLADLVDIPFDEFVVYRDGAPADVVNEVAGREVVRGRFFTNATQLFVFLRDGSASAAVMVSADVFKNSAYSRTFGPEALIAAPGGRGLLTIEG